MSSFSEEKTSTLEGPNGSGVPGLHWLPNIDRSQSALNCQVLRVNHIALIVADVGISATFYADVLGLQQINRPDFDRHGAWFTMGNIELHLIKGTPLVVSEPETSGLDIVILFGILKCDLTA